MITISPWLQGFCAGALLITAAYLLLTIWAALSLNHPAPPPPPRPGVDP